MDGVNPIYFETIKMCDPLHFIFIHSYGLVYISYPAVSPSPSSKQLSTSSSSSGGAHVRWNSAGANGAGSDLSGAASDAGLDPTQVHYVTSYSDAELGTFHCEPVRKMLLSGLDSSMLIGFLWMIGSIFDAGWQRCAALTYLFKKHNTIFSIVDEPPSWLDADDSLRSMSDPEEDEEDMPDDKDSSRSGQCDADVETREDEDEDSSDVFFDAGEGAVISANRLSSRAASESGTAVDVDFSRTISSDSADLDDGEWVDPTPIPPTPLEPSPPTFPPPIIAKSKPSSSTKNRNRKEHRAHVPFPSSAVEGAFEDWPRRVPQMSTGRGWDAERMQSGCVKGVIAPEPAPAEPNDLLSISYHSTL
ncbi:hypothetical protein EI94DRAFT_1828620 [Lactarius quietus]|nr:hypothetical protein EI94DRAFT_1828620 [Lactarius quietus]